MSAALRLLGQDLRPQARLLLFPLTVDQGIVMDFSSCTSKEKKVQPPSNIHSAKPPARLFAGAIL
jgi:hypothetical protein